MKLCEHDHCNNNNDDDDYDDGDDKNNNKNKNKNNNNYNGKCTEMRNSRFFQQSATCAASCLRQAQCAVVCKSRATHRALITCHMVRWGSSVINFDRIEITFTIFFLYFSVFEKVISSSFLGIYLL